MKLIDYHVHTDASYDCDVSMAAMCEQAVGRGVHEICFTDHFNNHLMDLDLGYYDPDRYFRALEDCRQQFPQLIILAGIELGEPHRWGRKIRPILEAYPYDIVLGSVHWVGRENLFNPDYFYTRTPQVAYREYFAEALRMVEAGGFDILAHVDLPKRLGSSIFGAFESAHYEDELRRLWAACIKHGITPEINTKGLRSAAKQLHPTVEALRWYAEMGGARLTFGSDAHHAESVADGFDAARQAALQAGLHYLCRYRQRGIVGWEALVG
jgi:histidinol-phosphatase (PHP family)